MNVKIFIEVEPWSIAVAKKDWCANCDIAHYLHSA